jgi:hypothetical protein
MLRAGNAALFSHHSIGFNSVLAVTAAVVDALETLRGGPKMVEYARSLGWNSGSGFHRALAPVGS